MNTPVLTQLEEQRAPWNWEFSEEEEQEEICILYNNIDGDTREVNYDEYIIYPACNAVSEDYEGWMQEGIMTRDVYEGSYLGL